ncbi:MAG: DUF87 domain-containing protein, partial [Bdellovibrionaceae bacterium]|nr:DUF87 domain-containing protein [Pseudobdellovibrionaceae bacterium]
PCLGCGFCFARSPKPDRRERLTSRPRSPKRCSTRRSIDEFQLNNGQAPKWMLAFWTFVIVVRELEFDRLVRVILDWFQGRGTVSIGSVSHFRQPGVARFRLHGEAACAKGSIVAFTKAGVVEEHDPIGVVTTNYISPSETICEAIIIDKHFNDFSVNSHSYVVKVEDGDPALEQRLSRNSIFQKLIALIGYASRNTDIGTLKFDLIKRPLIEEGHLVQVDTGNGGDVLFQVVDGLHTEDSSHGNNERRYTVGTAEQIGTWNGEKQCFETYSWVVSENAPVFHVTQDRKVAKAQRNGISDIGHIPNSNFPVNISLSDLTLYHSAILGVTGSGKSFLAYHLIESLADMGVRVLCLDGTGDYKRHLKNAVQIKLPSHVGPFLDSATHKIGIIEFHDDRTHPIDATKTITETAYNWCKKNRRDDEIKNPSPKVLIVFEEAHTLIPEWNFADRDKQNVVNQISQRVLQARKYGLGFMVITQRTANVTKSVLNQCNTIFSFQAYDETGFDFLKNYMGDQYVRALPNLKQRHGILVGKASLSDRPLIVRFYDQDRALNETIAEFVPLAAEPAVELKKADPWE